MLYPSVQRAAAWHLHFIPVTADIIVAVTVIICCMLHAGEYSLSLGCCSFLNPPGRSLSRNPLSYVFSMFWDITNLGPVDRLLRAGMSAISHTSSLLSPCYHYQLFWTLGPDHGLYSKGLHVGNAKLRINEKVGCEGVHLMFEPLEPKLYEEVERSTVG
jgi:hypothetical protein